MQKQKIIFYHTFNYQIDKLQLLLQISSSSIDFQLRKYTYVFDQYGHFLVMINKIITLLSQYTLDSKFIFMKISLTKNIPRSSNQQQPINPQCRFFNFNLQPIQVNYKKRSFSKTDRFMVGAQIPERPNRSKSGIKLTKTMPQMQSKIIVRHQPMESNKSVLEKQKTQYKELSPKKIKIKVQNSSDANIFTQSNHQKYYGSWKIPKFSVQQKLVKQKGRFVTQPQYISQMASKIMKVDTKNQTYSYKLYGQEYTINDSSKNTYNYSQLNDQKREKMMNNPTEFNYERNRNDFSSKVSNNKNYYNTQINRNITNHPNANNNTSMQNIQSNTIPVINVKIDLRNSDKDSTKQTPVPIPSQNQITSNSKIKQENTHNLNIVEGTQNGKLSKYMNSTETSKHQDNIWTSVNILNNVHESQKKVQSSRFPSYYRSIISSRSQSSNIKITPQQTKNTYLQRPIKDLEQARQVNTVITGDIEASQHDLSRSYSRNIFLKELECQMNQSIKILGHSTVVAKTSNSYQQGFWK